MPARNAHLYYVNAKLLPVGIFFKKFLRVSTISTTNNHLGKANSVIQRILEMQMELVEFFSFTYSYSSQYSQQLPRHDLALVIPFQNLKIIIFTRFSLLKGKVQHRMPWLMSCENESQGVFFESVCADDPQRSKIREKVYFLQKFPPLIST